MKKKYFLLVALISFFSQVTEAKKTPVTWGKVDQRDIEMKTWQEDPDAPAVILCDYGTLTIGPRTVYTRHYRIKILKEEGLKYAQVELPYRALNHYETFTQFNAQTLSPDETGHLRTIKVRKTSEKFIDRKHQAKTFTFPEAKVGSILEFRYTLVSLDFVKPDDWAFRHEVPCIWSEFKVNIPSDFYYLVTLENKQDLSMEQQQQFASSLQWLYSNTSPDILRETLNTRDILFSAKGQRTTYFLSGRSMNFIMQNQPALRVNADGIPTEEEYPVIKSHLFLCYGYFPFWYKHLLLSAEEEYDDWDTAQIRSHLSRSMNYLQYYLPTWQEMNTYWLDSERFGKCYRKYPEIPENIAGKARNENGKMATAINIYETVQKTVTWNGEYSMYANKNPRKLLQDGTGTSGEINLLLWSALKAAGLDADPVLVKTTFGKPETLYPVRDQFNHVVVRLVLDGDIIYLDAIHAEKPFRYLDNNIKGALGWMVSEKGEWVDVDNTDPEIRLHQFAFMQ